MTLLCLRHACAAATLRRCATGQVPATLRRISGQPMRRTWRHWPVLTSTRASQGGTTRSSLARHLTGSSAVLDGDKQPMKANDAQDDTADYLSFLSPEEKEELEERHARAFRQSIEEYDLDEERLATASTKVRTMGMVYPSIEETWVDTVLDDTIAEDSIEADRLRMVLQDYLYLVNKEPKKAAQPQAQEKFIVSLCQALNDVATKFPVVALHIGIESIINDMEDMKIKPTAAMASNLLGCALVSPLYTFQFSKSVFDCLVELGLKPTVDTYNLLLKKAAGCPDASFGTTVEILTQMMEKRVIPSPKSYELAFSAQAGGADRGATFESTLKVFNVLAEAEGTLTPKAGQHMMKLLADAGRKDMTPAEAVEVINAVSFSTGLPESPLAAMLLRSVGRRSFLQAKVIYDELVPYRVSPSTDLAEAMTWACASNKDSLLAFGEAYFTELMANDLPRTSAVYRNLLHACARHADGRFDKAVTIMALARKDNVTHSPSLYEAFLSVCAAGRGGKDAAIAALNTYKEEIGRPSARMYELTISSLLHEQSPTFAEAMDLVTQLRQSGLTPTLGVYHALLKVCALASDGSSLIAADILVGMIKSGVRPNLHTVSLVRKVVKEHPTDSAIPLRALEDIKHASTLVHRLEPQFYIQGAQARRLEEADDIAKVAEALEAGSESRFESAKAASTAEGSDGTDAGSSNERQSKGKSGGGSGKKRGKK